MSTLKAAYPLPSGQMIEITQGDITREHVDAIINAANLHLSHGAGVARAILEAGGWIIQEESNAWIRQNGPVSHAEPAYTSAGKLPCRFVIHAVGPIWGEGEEDRKLTEAVRGSLSLAERLGLRSLAFPAISTGIFGFPKERAARIVLATLRDYYTQNPSSAVQLVRLVLWDEETVTVFTAEAHSL
ncbi:MAG: macro domain-containing protein [Anaerolineaceae bacterium]|nr:macro domain-containing protein [Anaerolineaceae bacterium]